MNIAALVQNQSLTASLAALARVNALAAGQTVTASLLTLGSDGKAVAEINGEKVVLLLAGNESRGASLQPGAALTLRIDAADGGALRATLLSARMPADAAQAAGSRSALATGAAQAPAQPQTPASAVADSALSARALAGPLLSNALARQDSMAPLFANLASLAGTSTAGALPKPLQDAIAEVLNKAIPAEGQPVSAEALKRAIAGSGLFFEARAAAIAGTMPASPQPTAQTDLKAALQALREALQPVLPAEGVRTDGRSGGQPQTPPEGAPAPRPAAPRRDGPLTPQPPAEPDLAVTDKPATIPRTLLDQTEAALDRIKLAQYASLPAEPSRPDATQGQRWIVEVPLALANGTAILPLQIEKEPERRKASNVTAPLWRIRFALDAEPLGAVQGLITLQGRAVSVSLWTEREETSRLLRGAAPHLQAALIEGAFEDGSVDIHTGLPQAKRAAAGQFLDRRS